MNVGPDATALLEDYARGRADAVTVCEAQLARIEAQEPVLNAFSARSDTVMEEAAASARRWAEGAPAGPLDGVPVIVKDNLVSAGLPTAWGNAALAGRVATADERPVAALRSAGAIVLGKGNCPEFAIEGYTANATFGVTRNPYDPTLTPGGSSGGVVAAVAAGMAVAGLATDGGGSIRRPAGYTGLWGLKPGIGTVPRGGGLPQVLLDFETVGPVTRSARDLALLHNVLAGQRSSVPARGLRVLAVSRVGEAPCDPHILAVFEATVARLRRLGHSVQAGELPVDLSPLNGAWSRIVEVGLAHLARAEPAAMRAASHAHRERAECGAVRSAAEFYSALERVFALREAAGDLWGFDAVLMPTAAAPPWPAECPYPEQIGGCAVGPRGHAIFTGWVNAAGLPALAFPAGDSEDLPTGMQLIARRHGEPLLLACADTLARDGRTRAASATRQRG